MTYLPAALWGLLLTGSLLACQAIRPAVTSAPATRQKDIDLLRNYLVGDFENADQVKTEARARITGTAHPLARRVNRVADDRIRNRPDSLRGFFLLEESYFTYPGVEMQIKPNLFFFEEIPSGAVRLHLLQLPAGMDRKQVRNDNKSLTFDYAGLTESMRFDPNTYARTDRGFYLNAATGRSDSLLVRREETIGPNSLDVLELTVKAGKRLTPYDSPIQYRRIN